MTLSEYIGAIEQIGSGKSVADVSGQHNVWLYEVPPISHYRYACVAHELLMRSETVGPSVCLDRPMNQERTMRLGVYV